MRDRRLGDRLFATFAWGAAAATVAVLAGIVGDVVRRGIAGLGPRFLVTAPLDAGRAGGIFPVLVATAAILAVCLAATVPLGLATAIGLAELGRRLGRFAHLVRRSLDVLAAVPSIVFGLFGNAFFCLALGLGFSILSGGLTLACMALPLFVRSAEAGLRAVPDGHRRAAAALGLSRTTTVRRVLLPQAMPGIVVGLVLAVGRALAETAALIFTSGYVTRMPGSLLDSGRALSVHVYDLAMNVAGGETNANASALVLIAAVLAVDAAACHLGERLGPPRERL